MSEPDGGRVHPPDEADERLPCGRRLDEAWEAVTAPVPDEHARTCPWCADLARHVTGLNLLLDVPEGEADEPALVVRILSEVIADLRSGRRVPLAEPGLHVGEHVVAAAVRERVDAVPQALARRVRVRPVEGSPGVVDLVVRVVVDHGASVPDVAERVRAAAGRGLADVGLAPGSTDVDVVDVTAPPPGG
jgi:hypothetical protein